MDMSDPLLERKLPKIKDAGYKVTSPESRRYNCIAWSLGRVDMWIWPDPNFFWPANIEINLKLSSFVDLYQMFGYITSENEKLEEGYEKIAIYMNPEIGIVTHGARQTELGKWSSKLGPYKDIEHNTLESLTGPDYGIVAMIMKRKITN
jgi:type VI secretion system secreted protein VgrG